MNINFFKYYSLKRFKLVLAVALALLSLSLRYLKPISDLENRFLDYRFHSWIGDVKPDERILIVTIDDNSLDYFSENGVSWPWPRSFYAHVVNYLKASGARSVVFDMLFSHPDADRSETDADETDSLFAAALKNADNGILGLAMDNSTADKHIWGTHPIISKRGYLAGIQRDSLLDIPIPALLEATASLGHTNISPDGDGIFRRVSPFANYQGQLIPNLAISTMLLTSAQTEAIYSKTSVYLGEDRIPLDSEGRQVINWYGKAGPSGVFPYLPFSAVIQSASAVQYGGDPPLPPQRFRDKIIIIGADASGLRDLKASPIMKDGMHPGMEVWATTLSNQLMKHYIYEFPVYLLFLILSAMAFVVLLTFDRLKPRYGFLILIGQLVMFIALGYVLWRGASRILLPFAPAMVISLLAYLLVLSNEMRERLFLKRVFGAYIAPELMDLMHLTREVPALGGEQIEGSAYFTDIQGFTSFSEQLSPEKLVALLNEYLTEMTDTLMSFRGTLDKYEGDAIIAFFGAPIADPDHALQAVKTGIAMQNGLARLRQKWSSEGTEWPEEIKDIQMRIGINSGDMLVGNVGSAGRMNYTMMGDTVNVAARLESSAKQYGVLTQISEATAVLMPSDIALRKLGATRLVGKSRAAVSFEVLGYRSELSEQDLELLKVWPAALAAIDHRDWDQAELLFKQTEALERVYNARPTNPSRVYLEQRIPVWKAQVSGENWEAIWVFDSK